MGWLVLLLFIIIVLIVWIALTRNTKQYQPDFKVEAHDEPHANETADAEMELPDRGEEVSLSSPVKLDDLTIIEGIGPKVSSLLNGIGIFTLSELASADLDQIKELLANSGLQFIDPSTWKEQAALAAEGKHAEFEALKQQLKGGRRNS